MTIFIHGLRRSGTTILYDILSEDDRISSFYEPLSLGKASYGGGSGAKAGNIMMSLSEARVQAGYLGGGNGDPRLNYGAPTNYKLESRRGRLPDDIREYLATIVKKDSLLKFTRATFFAKDLYDLDPDAVFVHIRKDPRRFAASHMCVKEYGSKLCSDSSLFFSKKVGFNQWSQEYISNLYLKENKREYLDKPAYFKLLYLWKEFGKVTEEGAANLFGDRYIEVTAEGLYFNQIEVLNHIYKKIGRRTPGSVLAWANSNVRKPRGILFKKDQRWQSAFGEIGIESDK